MLPTPLNKNSAEHVDVIVVGAGVSGIGAACALHRQCPDRSFVLLDDHTSFGGTWITHRFPGVRSDSDLYTYGYSFKPWKGPPIATAAEILAYLTEVIAENRLGPHIRYQHRVLEAHWSGDTNRWTLKVRSPAGEMTLTTDFLFPVPGLLPS